MDSQKTYGSISRNSVQNNNEQNHDEETSLLGKKSRTLNQHLRSHLTVNVDRKWADLILLFGYCITGLLDSSAVFIWGAFVSMQTGNTIYFGLGIIEPNSGTRWIKSAVSIIAFCLGSLYFSRFHRYFSPQKRWVLMASYFTQAMLCMAAALMVTFETTKDFDLTGNVLVPLAMLAFQSSGQTVTSRVLKYNGQTSVVLTSTYCDLFSDQELFSAGITENSERNRRIASPLLLLVGAACGGLFAKSPVGLSGALWTAVAGKLLIVVLWFFWGEEKKKQEEER